MPALNRNASAWLLERKCPDAVALWTLNGSWDYSRLTALVHGSIDALAERSVRPGERVLLAAENGPFWVAAYLATLHAGCVCVPVAPGVRPEDLKTIVESVEPACVFAGDSFAARHRKNLEGYPLIGPGDVRSNPASLPEPAGGGSDLAALMFTSGSTGTPRGVMISHANIIANTDAIVSYLRLTAIERILTVLPFHYCFGTSLLHTHLRVCASLVIEPRFMYPELVLRRMIETQCTGFAGVPSHFQILLRRSSLRMKQFPHLRYIQQAGGHLAPALIRELRTALPGVDFYVMYGQTEATARLSYLPPALLNLKPDSIGRGIPGVRLAVLNAAGQSVQPGEVGELVADGANVALGYWKAPVETATTFRDGRLYTGDLATLDGDGFVYVVGRAKDFLKCGGKRVACRQIEDWVMSCEDVLEVAAVGVQDEILGEAVRIFVVPKSDNAVDLPRRLQRHCRANMPLEFVPRDIVVVRALPKNDSGKVLKETLRSMYSSSATPDAAGRLESSSVSPGV